MHSELQVDGGALVCCIVLKSSSIITELLYEVKCIDEYLINQSQIKWLGYLLGKLGDEIIPLLSVITPPQSLLIMGTV